MLPQWIPSLPWRASPEPKWWMTVSCEISWNWRKTISVKLNLCKKINMKEKYCLRTQTWLLIDLLVLINVWHFSGSLLLKLLPWLQLKRNKVATESLLCRQTCSWKWLELWNDPVNRPSATLLYSSNLLSLSGNQNMFTNIICLTRSGSFFTDASSLLASCQLAMWSANCYYFDEKIVGHYFVILWI